MKVQASERLCCFVFRTVAWHGFVGFCLFLNTHSEITAFKNCNYRMYSRAPSSGGQKAV